MMQSLEQDQGTPAVPLPRVPAGPGYRLFHYVMIVVVIAGLAVSAVGIGSGVRVWLQADPRFATVRLVSGGAAVSGASSKLLRNDDGADYEFSTSGLPDGHVITLRAVIFNQPDQCAHGDARVRCGDGDLENPATEGSVMLLTSGLLRHQTAFHMKGTVAAGKADQLVSGDGLTNPRGADIHFVLLDHGAPTTELYAEMLQTLRGGCTTAGPGEGTPGPNECADLQIAAHERR